MISGSKLRGVGIGAGYFAPFHYEAWSRIPEVEIAAICDLDEDKARSLAAGHCIGRVYSDWRTMLEAERPDFVDIITPPKTHEEICAFAAQRGIHIICQKPLAPDVETSRRIVELTDSSGIRFMVHENWRWQPWYRMMKKIAEAKTIGEFVHMNVLTRLGDGWGDNPYSPRQPFFRSYPRLLIFETGVHFIDTFRFIFGEVASVFAELRRMNPLIEGEDAVLLYLRFRSGASAVWDANRYTESEAVTPRLTFGEVRVDATEGHLTLDSDANLRVKRLGKEAYDIPYSFSSSNFAGDCVYNTQRHFIDRVRDGLPFESSGQDYLKTLAVVEAAYESGLSGRVVPLVEAEER
jgi:predicted dehydrogenase